MEYHRKHLVFDEMYVERFHKSPHREDDDDIREQGYKEIEKETGRKRPEVDILMYECSSTDED
jgi:hypothetical protein